MKQKMYFSAILAVLFCALSVSVRAETFTAYLNGAQEVPGVATSATGYARVVVNQSAGTLTFTVVFTNLSSAQILSHIHAPGALGATAPVTIDFGTVGGTSGTISGTRSITPTQLAQIRQHLGYVNVHSSNFPGGEIRGQLGINRPVDSDGDGRTDFSVLRFPNVPPPGVAQINYHTLGSTGGYTVTPFGNANTDFPVPGDYDGDTKDDIAIYRNGANPGDQSEMWILFSANATFHRIFFGTSGDQAINRDYDGDGRTDLAVYRRGVNTTDPAYWYIRKSSVSNTDCGCGGPGQPPDTFFEVTQFGLSMDTVNFIGDTPVPGDYDGDGKFDLAVYRFGGIAPNNTFIIKRSSDGGITYQQWGDFQTDYIAPGDFDGDGKTDYCAVRTGASASVPMFWWILQSSNGQVRIQQFGISSDRVVQGDYDGDARTDIAIYRSTGFFWVLGSFTNTVQLTDWGQTGDFPVATFDAR
jgi:hypothetical protein